MALEYRQQTGWLQLTQQAVLSARASQGVSYVLFTNNVLKEYADTPLASAPSHWAQLPASFNAIDAGTDYQGVNVVVAIDGANAAWEFSDSQWGNSSPDWVLIPVNGPVRSISAGQQGYVAVVKANGNAFRFNDANLSAGGTLLGSGVIAATAGTSPAGMCVVDLLYGNNQAWEYRTADPGWLYYLDGNVTSLSKKRNGVLDLVYTDGSVWELNWGWFYYLTGNSTNKVVAAG